VAKPTRSATASLTGSGTLAAVPVAQTKAANLSGSGALSAPTFAAVQFAGGGFGSMVEGAASTAWSTSWSHNIPTSGAHTVAIATIVTSHYGHASSLYSMDVKYGGIPMTQAGIQASWVDTQSGVGCAIFYLFNPPTGPQTVTATTTGAVSITAIQGNSMAYKYANAVGNFTTATGLSNSALVTVPSQLGALVVGVVGAPTNFGAAVVGNTRYSGGDGGAQGWGDYAWAMDAAGSSSTTIGLTLNMNPFARWIVGGVSVT
jgi:hypothetical protein